MYIGYRTCALSYRRFRLYKAVRIIPHRSVSFFYSLCFDNRAKQPYIHLWQRKKKQVEAEEDKLTSLDVINTPHCGSLCLSATVSQVISLSTVELGCSIYMLGIQSRAAVSSSCPITSVSCRQPFARVLLRHRRSIHARCNIHCLFLLSFDSI